MQVIYRLETSRRICEICGTHSYIQSRKWNAKNNNNRKYISRREYESVLNVGVGVTSCALYFTLVTNVCCWFNYDFNLLRITSTCTGANSNRNGDLLQLNTGITWSSPNIQTHGLRLSSRFPELAMMYDISMNGSCLQLYLI